MRMYRRGNGCCLSWRWCNSRHNSAEWDQQVEEVRAAVSVYSAGTVSLQGQSDVSRWWRRYLYLSGGCISKSPLRP